MAKDKIDITAKMRDFEKVRKVINSCVTTAQMSCAWEMCKLWLSRYNDYAMHMMHTDWWSERNNLVLKWQRHGNNTGVIDFTADSDSNIHLYD